ncbi:hypothetical protein [Chryseobacterium pennipullorum]|uniref:Cytochrome C551 n=1 Tax=Chryseobacterium pennipullorum TaxID=2258963 RepID=A0A3D9AVS5_9FLAO|nr:hypothetical protein [Chryseobacterium pennipullorum]REC45454.1 hypothetical protein DRF67_16080 [Chryseobacterium pennipullorum]
MKFIMSLMLIGFVVLSCKKETKSETSITTDSIITDSVKVDTAVTSSPMPADTMRTDPATTKYLDSMNASGNAPSKK